MTKNLYLFTTEVNSVPKWILRHSPVLNPAKVEECTIMSLKLHHTRSNGLSDKDEVYSKPIF